MIIKQNISLKPYNTFGIEAKATDFIEINSIEGLNFIIDNFNLAHRKLMVIGGGSNILLTKDYDGLVLKMNITGIEKVAEDDNAVYIKAMAGEKWHSFVLYCVNNGYAGVENLSLIPGFVGAAPMQNIGAYGVELKDVFDSLVTIDLRTGKEKILKLADCKFGYRDSIFKKKLKGKYFIYQVTVKLSKKPNLTNVIAAIFKIRNGKLPNPVILPNAGSFFKNPEISVAQFKKLQNKYPDIKSFVSGKKIKIPAGWLIETAGLKGKKFGPVSMYEKQALILVNHGGATASQILRHIDRVQAAVLKQFGIKLEPEVNII